MPYVTIKNIITFAPNWGVLVEKEATSVSPDELHALIKLAWSHMDDEPLVDACCGGRGPLAGYGQISYENYLELLRQIEIQNATKRAKREHTKTRRAQYSAMRSQLVLALIERGTPYVCTHPGCGATNSLTLDHIVPLSKGGSDNLDNLQFMLQA